MTQSSGTQTQQTQQQGTTAPWQPAQPGLQNILSQLGGVNTGVTPYQTSALNALEQNSANLPNFSNQIVGLGQQYLNPAGAQNQYLNNGVNTVGGTLANYTNPNYLNPYNNPATSQLLNTLNQQIGNNINGQFAAAGRDMSPANTQALAMGLSQGEAPTLFNQYNTNAQNQQNATQQWLGALGMQNQAQLQNYGFGANLANQSPNFINQAPLSMLAAANQAYNLPLSQLGGVESMTLPIAGLGSQYQGTGQTNTQTSYTPSVLQDIAMGGQAFSNFLNPFGGGGAFASGGRFG